MGGKFKAMTLISEAELARMRDQQLTDYNPSVRSMTKLQTLIEKVFDDKNLSAEEKQKVLNTLQERFSQLYTKFKDSVSSAAPLSLSTTPAPPPSPTLSIAYSDDTVKSKNQIFADTVSNTGSDRSAGSNAAFESSFVFPQVDLAQRYARKLGIFKQFLKDNKDAITSSRRNELVLDGKIFPNSSFSDLVRHMYVRGSKLNLTGSEEFMQKLAMLNVDPTMFSNSDSKLLLSNIFDPGKGPPLLRKAQTGKGLKRNVSVSHSSAPPGKLPRILRLFRI